MRPKVLGIVHAETSTGALQDISELGKLCHEFDALLVTDCVTSLGCTPVETRRVGGGRRVQLLAEGAELPARACRR